MKNAIAPVLFIILLVACGTDSGTGGNSGDEHKWSVAIAGYPPQSGNILQAVTMGGNGKYTLGRSGFRASIDFTADDPVGLMMINFEKEAVRCVNKQGASAVRKGGRAILSGEVMCYPKSGSFEEAQPAAISGYFQLKE